LTGFKFFIKCCSFFSGLSKSATFKRSISCQILSAIISLWFLLDHHVAFICNQLTVWPVSSLQFGEYKQTLIAYFEGACSWDLLEIWTCFVIILDKVIVDVKIKILFRNLVFHDHSTGNAINNALGDFLEKLLVLGFIVPSVPSVLLTILASFYYEDEVWHFWKGVFYIFNII
jgi:hypothetical protein